MTVESSSPRSVARILIFLALVAVIVVVMLATGWADDKAPPGSQGRGGPVTYTAPADAR
jgi:hypothetical protein